MSLIIPKKPQILYAPMLGSLGGGSVRGFGRGVGGASGLYEFGNNSNSGAFRFRGYSFNEKTGISLTDARNQYASDYPALNFFQDPAFFNITQAGYQLWTVPATATYKIEARGAAGGYQQWQQSGTHQGYGGYAKGNFDLIQGNVITIACGHIGANSGNTSAGQASGGGGTFVVSNNYYAGVGLSDVMLVGGGGGGGFGGNSQGGSHSHGGHNGSHGGSSQSQNGNTVAGEGGLGGRLSDGGGGVLYNGQQQGTSDAPSNHGYFGQAYVNGLVGGDGNTGQMNHACSGTSMTRIDGGFGGGGGGSYAANGAGGGYTGGSGSDGCNQGGGGGGGSIANTSHSFYAGNGHTSGGNNTTYGTVHIERL